MIYNDLSEYNYFNDLTKCIFSSLNGIINKIIPAQLIVEDCDYTTLAGGKIFGNTLYPNMVYIYLPGIIDEFNSSVNQRVEKIFTLLCMTIVHELFHCDQDMSDAIPGINLEYRISLRESAVISKTKEFILSNTNELEQKFGIKINVCTVYTYSAGDTPEANYIPTNMQNFYTNNLIHVIYQSENYLKNTVYIDNMINLMSSASIRNAGLVLTIMHKGKLETISVPIKNNWVFINDASEFCRVANIFNMRVGNFKFAYSVEEKAGNDFYGNQMMYNELTIHIEFDTSDFLKKVMIPIK